MFQGPFLNWFIVALLPAVIPGLPPTGLQLASPEQLRTIPLASMPYSGVDLPEQVDLSEHMPPPGDQGRQNSCVGWATAYVVKSYQEHLEQNQPLAHPDGSPDWRRVFSPAFVYNLLNNGRDGGITYVDALNLLSGQGVVPWAEMPYDMDDFRRKPGPALMQQAKAWRIDYWRQVNVLDLKEIKAHLQAGFPVMIGALIDQGFYHARKGHVWKKREGKSLGGHALVLVGYDDRRQAFRLINSWGPRWADGGFGWIDYAWFPRVVREGFVAKDAINGLPRLASRPGSSSEHLGGADQNLLQTIDKEEERALPVLRLSGSLELPHGSSPEVIVRIYALENGLPGILLSSHRVSHFSAQSRWQLDLPRQDLNLDKHPEAHTGQVLGVRVVPEFFVEGFGVGTGTPQTLELPAPSPPLNQTAVRAAFVKAWQQQDDTRLWQLLGPLARQELLDYLIATQQEPDFTRRHWRELLEKGHPLMRQLLWNRMVFSLDNRSLGTSRPLPLIPQGKSWKIQSLRDWLP